MAKQDINIGAAANDGTGDSLRNSFDKTNDNFTELYNVGGWAYYKDDESSPATQVFSSTFSQLQINGADANSTSAYLPYEIRGSGELWDTANNKITPIAVGDSYSLRLDLEITATSSNPTRFKVALDIGATPDGTGGAGSIVIVDRSVTLKTGTPQSHTIGFPIFSLSTFISNGGTIWVSADSGTITVAGRAISLYRISSGQI